MDLYKIISQLTDQEFEEIHNTFTANKADKSAAFVKIIRENPDTPDKQFLDEFDITPSAFYVLKSRLSQKIETYLLNRVGDPNLHVMRRVLAVSELVFSNPREISVAALRKLEKELLRFDFPYGLMIVYKELQNLHAFDEHQQLYRSKYNQQVANAVAMDKALDLVIHFFRLYDAFFLSRKERDHTEMIRTMEKIDNLNNLYESHRLYIYKSIIHIFAKLFVDIPDTIRVEMEPVESMFEKSFEILKEYQEDAFYMNINILFNYLRFVYYDQRGVTDKSKIYFEILDYKLEELITRYHLNVNTSLFLYYKLRYHIRTNTVSQLAKECDDFIGQYEVEPYRMSYYLNYHMFLAHVYFLDRNYKKASRVLYKLRNEVNLRKYAHSDLEVKFFLTLTYVMMEDFDLANQLILSLQRQLRKGALGKYEHAKTLLKILSVALGGKPRTRAKNLKSNIDRWKQENIGWTALLPELDLEQVFLGDHA
jgi:hypothetical protein